MTARVFGKVHACFASVDHIRAPLHGLGMHLVSEPASHVLSTSAATGNCIDDIVEGALSCM